MVMLYPDCFSATRLAEERILDESELLTGARNLAAPPY